ncbi:MAG: 4-hydroxy-tetrahydrodipicolinate synthase [Steroidobacteraceae bacterium]
MFSGSLVAIVTPMRTDGAVDPAAWSRLIDFHLENGTSGIVIGGTTGESATLTDAELGELTERTCAQTARRIAVIAGAGSSSTAATVERARWLSQLPIDALLVVTPAYNRPTQEGLYQHFAAVARASRVPVIAYNVPSRTAVDMLPETVARLSQLDGIVAIKEAVPEIERVRQLRAQCRQGFDVLSGDDATAREAALAGAVGVVSVTANVAPRSMARLMAAAVRGESVDAAELDAPLAVLHRALFVEANPIPVKWALQRMGRIERGIRLPLTELSERHHVAVLEALRASGALGR